MKLARLKSSQDPDSPSAVDVASDGSDMNVSETEELSPGPVDETVLRVTVQDVLLDKYVVEVTKTVETEDDPVPVPPKTPEDELPGYGTPLVVNGRM